MKSEKLREWLHRGGHLPGPLRDFHDAKRVFKAMHIIMPGDPDALIKQPDWVTGHCYVIDVFLWFMAERGWTLQRSRCDLEFRDLNTDLNNLKPILSTGAAPTPTETTHS